MSQEEPGGSGGRFGINVSIEAKTVERAVATLDKVVDVALDTFSPVQHAMLALSQYMKAAKVYGTLTLMRTFKRAKEIAVEEGLELELPPQKFMLPYLEAASFRG